MLSRLASLGIGVVFATGLFSGCGEKTSAEPSDEVFIFARGSDAQKLDPADVEDGESVNTLAQICEGLVRFKSGTSEIEPCLAEAYTISEDGLRYRFKLRPGVEFHDGTPLNADTALFSFLRQMNEEHPGHLEEASFSYWRYLYQDIEKVEKVSDMEIEFRLREPNASLIYSLAVFPAYLISPKALDTYGDAFQRNPVGTGPYRFVEWRPDEAILMERNDLYWGEKPTMKRLVMTVVPDNTVRLLQLKKGAIHGMDGLQPAEIPALENDETVTVYQDVGLNVGYLVYNLDVERLARKEVREAIALAIDRDSLAKVGLSGGGRAANYPLPVGFLGYPENEDAIPYDPERARELVARNADAFEEPIRLNVMIDPRPYFPDPVSVASFIQGELEKVGIEVDVVSSDFKAHLDDLRNGEIELGLIGWIGDNGDTDNFLSVFFASWAAEKGTATNYSFYRNDEMDGLLRAGRRETDMAKRGEIYERALELWRRDLPILPLVHGDNIVALNSGYEGFELQRIADLRLGWIRPR
ncbi:MAG: ABC transporter substrate-binding protein [Verrucomicrobiota bacterium]